MKDIKNIIADLQAWVEEDKENREIALVAVQKTDETEEKYESDRHVATMGIMGYLVDAFQSVLNDNDRDNGLREVLRRALRREALTGLAMVVNRMLKNIDKKSENGSEKGKEADHE